MNNSSLSLETRLAWLEQQTALQIDDKMRELLKKSLQQLDETIQALRDFPLEDGASEPALLFQAKERDVL